MSLHHKRLNPARWQHARRAALERDGYRCTKCVEQGLGGAGKLEVHHITPLHKSGSAYELANLATICRDHHIEHSVFGPRWEWRRYLKTKFQEINQ